MSQAIGFSQQAELRHGQFFRPPGRLDSGIFKQGQRVGHQGFQRRAQHLAALTKGRGHDEFETARISRRQWFRSRDQLNHGGGDRGGWCEGATINVE